MQCTRTLFHTLLLTGICSALLLLASCSKDDPSLGLVGTWSPLQVQPYTYLVLSKDHISYQIIKSKSNVHLLSQAIYASTSTQIEGILTFTLGTSLYNYRIAGDTLYLQYGAITNTFIRATAIDPATWNKVAPLSETTVLGYNGILGPLEFWAGKPLIYGSYIQTLYQLASGASQPSDSAAIAIQALGMTVVNNQVMMTSKNDSVLHLISITTGTEVATSKIAPGKLGAVAQTDATHFMVLSDVGILQYDVTAQTWTKLNPFYVGATNYIGDMLVQGGYAYITYAGIIIKLDLTTYTATETYRLDGGLIAVGLGYDGTSFWVLTEENAFTIGQVALSKIQFPS
jgi:hypothetical protein